MASDRSVSAVERAEQQLGKGGDSAANNACRCTARHGRIISMLSIRLPASKPVFLLSSPSGLLDVLDVSCIQSRRIRSDPPSTFPRKLKGITAWRSSIAAILQGWASSAACPTPLRPPSRHVPAFLRPFICCSENPLWDCTPVIWPGECRASFSCDQLCVARCDGSTGRACREIQAIKSTSCLPAPRAERLSICETETP